MNTYVNHFKRPLIIYRPNSEVSYKYFKEIITYLFENYYVELIYVIYFEIDNSSTIFSENKELQNKYKDKIIQFDNEKEQSDLCIIIGGDGSCLFTNILYKQKKRPPFITFFSGRLGYLSYYNIENYKEVFNELYKSELLYSEKNFVECSFFEEIIDDKGEKICKKVNKIYALNEILLNRGNSLKNLGFNIYIDNEFLTKVYADGILLSSPNGSTAYNLSNGGPLIDNENEQLVLTAVCPDSICFRPIVLPVNCNIIIKGSDPKKEIFVVQDGNKVFSINSNNQYVKVKLSEEKIKFIILSKYISNQESLWKEKIINSLKWNRAFQH